MAKKSVIYRNIKRKKTVEKYKDLREKLKETIANIHLAEGARWEAQEKLQQLPRDASPIRVRRRCRLTGRPRGVYRKVDLARTKFRECAALGILPGLTKASW
ncbi:MAG: 30S ribosomal protein S14 [Gammaproteobacteria bacterium RIFCSPLOWO2_02_FULL_38_11]|nr:MAG: 30S ribosomal protein S14 [Gammaproteobacteria bacterium RIFCSPHIGHO2_02_FULL_38_33]OGT23909.1 MAG: 30S ribosomal protein S14 [Gammaproteobacteria bacterium RIFCSPHIGHO2_12_38_15]OGT67123.1 MAG: 30S ribosomal protein S14 [Gammaproteobacteria bacterium RIFCSPLOWO2_02_FULL_38_11]OGT76118.1 MAG: 30S ribosomal protein S14 [Gammaproteobacteria bacterium RIFCSPLOWO2_12_FULL_38_14]